jgi:fatty acid desaturase
MSDAPPMHKVSPAVLRQLYQHTWYHNLKIPLFYAMIIAAGYVAWYAEPTWIRWLMYASLGYLWMSIVTFMHDCTHSVLFQKKWKNWAFGIFSTLPIIVTFISFKEDHLEHHRYNRTARDPDAFTMGNRRFMVIFCFSMRIS